MLSYYFEKERFFMNTVSHHKSRLTTYQLSLLGIMLGIRIVLSYLPSFNVGEYVQLGFGFIGAALSGALFGPFYAIILGILNDIITALLKGYNFFPGYTLSAALGGLFYALGLYRKSFTLKRIFITVLCVTVFINIGLGSLWIRMMTGKAWEVFMGLRIAKNVVSLFLNTGLIYLLFNQPTIKKFIEKRRF